MNSTSTIHRPEVSTRIPGREWEQRPPSDDDDLGREWDMHPATQTSDVGREWERTTLTAAPRRRRRWDTFVAIGAAVAFALVGAVVLDSGAQQVVPELTPVVDPAVAPSDLTPGAMYHVVDQVGARDLWAQGFTGDGVNVAVIDTGFAPVESLSAPGKVIAAVDFSEEGADPATARVDTYGHGTHMAGIIAGLEPGADPALAAEHPEWFLGVAPDAGLVSVKVGGRSGDVDTASVIAGIDWVVAHADELGIRVINLSIDSDPSVPYRADVLDAAVERAWAAGLVVVTAAGNDGPNTSGLASPASNPNVIAVGAADVSDSGISAADFTTRGDGVRNPDVAAPGAHIESLRAPGSDADLNHSDTGYVDPETFRGSGSSQAAAVVSGAVALLLEARPDLTPAQVKAALSASASPIVGATAEAVGAGLVSLDRLVDAIVAVVDEPTTRVEVDAVSDAKLDWSATSWAATSWAATSWAATSWAATSWAATSWAATSWAATSWAATSWAATSWAATSWAATSWAATSWAATSWAATSWAATSWAATSWAATSWAATSWAATSWAATSWAATSWAATSWAATSWAATSWAATSWAATSWAATSWAATSWAATSWAATSWAATSWAATSWAATSWAATSWAATSWAATSWAATSWAATSWA